MLADFTKTSGSHTRPIPFVAAQPHLYRAKKSEPRGYLQISAAVKKSGAKHVICSKTLVAKPDQTKRLLKKCQDILDFSVGRASNPENGIIEFSCNQDIHDKNVFHFWERYDGNTSLGRHNTTPEFVKFMEGVSFVQSSPASLPTQNYVLCMSGVREYNSALVELNLIEVTLHSAATS